MAGIDVSVSGALTLTQNMGYILHVAHKLQELLHKQVICCFLKKGDAESNTT